MRRLFGHHANLSTLRTRVLMGLGVTAVALGLVSLGGTAYAYLTSHGSGSGQTTTGSPVSVTVTAASGTADLLPGGTGSAYFTVHNSNNVGATFSSVTSASVVSKNTTACPNSNVSIAQALPHTFTPSVSVGAGATSGIQSISNLVQLSSSAPSTCQGVGFTVTLTLSGASS